MFPYTSLATEAAAWVDVASLVDVFAQCSPLYVLHKDYGYNVDISSILL